MREKEIDSRAQLAFLSPGLPIAALIGLPPLPAVTDNGLDIVGGAGLQDSPLSTIMVLGLLPSVLFVLVVFQ